MKVFVCISVNVCISVFWYMSMSVCWCYEYIRSLARYDWLERKYGLGFHVNKPLYYNCNICPHSSNKRLVLL